MIVATPAALLCTQRAADHRVALRAGEYLRWRDFRAAVAALTVQLQARPERRWALFHGDSYTFAIGLFALLHGGKTIVLPANAQPGTVAELAGQVDALLGEFPATTLPQLAIDERAAAAHAFAPLAEDAVAIELMTSGSTGSAKKIGKTLAQLGRELQCQEVLWGERLGAAAVLATVSHQHIYGLLFRVLWPLCAGRVFAAQAHAYWEPLLAELAALDAAVLVSSPAHLKRLPDGDTGLALPTLRAVFSSGSALPDAVVAEWPARLAAPPIEMFGSSETGGIAYREPLHTRAWTPLRGVHCRLDADGVLEVSSPFAGDAFVATGDCARLLPNGDIELLGRADQIVKLEEKRVSLVAMAERLQAHGWVRDARVVALAGERMQLGAVLELNAVGAAELQRRGRREFAAQLRDHLLQFFERVATPRKWRYVERMPVNSQGKVALAELRALFAAEPAAGLPGTVVHATARELAIEIDTADRALFAGHFPGVPILPGVLQVDWVVRHSRERWYPRHAFAGIDQLKFLQVIGPDRIVRLTLKDCGDGVVDFSFGAAARVFSSGRVLFGGADGL